MRSKIIAVSLSFFIPFISCKKEQKSDFAVFMIQSVIGDVRIERTGTSSSAVLGQVLTQSDSVVTGKTSTIDILCSSEGVIRVHELSRLNIESLLKTSEAVNTTLRLEKGKLFASFAKMKKESSVQVKTPTAIAAVRGTSFRVSAEETGSSVAVLSGKVQVNPIKDDIVVESVSQTVEQNKAVEISVKEVTAIAESKKAMTVSDIKPAVREEIKSETSGITVAVKSSEAVAAELESVGIESRKADIKPLSSDELKSRITDEKPVEVKASEPSSSPSKKDDTAAKALKEKNEKERIAKEKASAEKERAERERAEKEKAEKLRAEKEQAEKAEKAKEQKESRVKNIPNI